MRFLIFAKPGGTLDQKRGSWATLPFAAPITNLTYVKSQAVVTETAAAFNSLSMVAYLASSTNHSEIADAFLSGICTLVCSSQSESETTDASLTPKVSVVSAAATPTETVDAAIAAAGVISTTCCILSEYSDGTAIGLLLGVPVLLGSVTVETDASGSMLIGVSFGIASSASELATAAVSQSRSAVLGPAQLAELGDAALLVRVVAVPAICHQGIANTSLTTIVGTYSTLNMPAVAGVSVNQQVIIESSAGVMGMTASGYSDRWVCVACNIASGQTTDASLGPVCIVAMPPVNPLGATANVILNSVVWAWGFPSQFTCNISGDGPSVVSIEGTAGGMGITSAGSAVSRGVVPANRTQHQEIANFSGPIGWLVSFAASILTGTAISNASILVLGVELVSFSGVDLEELFSYYAVEVDPPSCDGVSSTTMIVTGLVTIPVQ